MLPDGSTAWTQPPAANEKLNQKGAIQNQFLKKFSQISVRTLCVQCGLRLQHMAHPKNYSKNPPAKLERSPLQNPIRKMRLRAGPQNEKDSAEERNFGAGGGSEGKCW